MSFWTDTWAAAVEDSLGGCTALPAALVALLKMLPGIASLLLFTPLLLILLKSVLRLLASALSVLDVKLLVSSTSERDDEMTEEPNLRLATFENKYR